MGKSAAQLQACVTGMASISASSTTSARPPEVHTSCPTNRSGFLASISIRASIGTDMLSREKISALCFW